MCLLTIAPVLARRAAYDDVPGRGPILAPSAGSVREEFAMAIDTFMAYVGVYDDPRDADADYQLVKDLHTKEDLIDAYDAAVVERRADGKVKITKKHETPTRAGGVLGGGIGLATGLVVALFPFAAIGGGLLAVTTGGGAILGAVAGHAAAGMSRKDLKELGEHLDAGQAGLVVVAVSDMGAKVERAMKKAKKVEAKELKADTADIEADATSAQAESEAPAQAQSDS
jgi:uncharacterized membrane protein